LNPGAYNIKITKEGYKDYTETVNIGAGETKSLSPNLELKPTLSISVWVDKGCDGNYTLYDPVTFYFKATQSGYVKIIDIPSNGEESTVFEGNINANTTYTKSGLIIAAPVGYERLKMQFTSTSGEYAETLCGFHVNYSSPLNATVDMWLGKSQYNVGEELDLYVSVSCNCAYEIYGWTEGKTEPHLVRSGYLSGGHTYLIKGIKISAPTGTEHLKIVVYCPDGNTITKEITFSSVGG